MKKYYIIAVLVGLLIAMFAFKSEPTSSGVKDKNYTDEVIKKAAYTRTLTKKEIYQLMYRPITASIEKYKSEYKCSPLELRRAITAMIILETGHLKAQSVAINSLTGIKKIKNRPSFRMPTTEYYLGIKVYEDHEFSAFFSFEDAIDNLFILWRKDIYKELREADNLEEFIEALDDSPYATDPNHGNKLFKILEGF